MLPCLTPPPQVRQLPELAQVNERCLDLQRSRASGSSSSSKKKASLQGAATSNVVGFLGASRPRQQQQQQRRQRKSAGCPYLSVEGGASAWDDFKSHVLRSPMDVEELASLGRKQKVGAQHVHCMHLLLNKVFVDVEKLSCQSDGHCRSICCCGLHTLTAWASCPWFQGSRLLQSPGSICVLVKGCWHHVCQPPHSSYVSTACEDMMVALR